MGVAKLKEIRKKYVPTTASALFVAAAISAVVHFISELSERFSDFVNSYISTVVRGLPAIITGVLPFSIAETIILLVPAILITAVYFCGRATKKSTVAGVRYVVSMGAVLALLYSMFVLSTAVAYNGTSLADKLGLKEEPVSAEELRITAEYIIEKMNRELDEIYFVPNRSSVMPYSYDEMNSLLMEAYDKAADKYDFIPRLYSRVKPIASSELLTYTHISGIYTYFTGEANINVNFPDYTIPYTAAHELAHQRGFLPEDEANFAAFLVCMESDDPYMRYSALLNMYQYLNSALYSADPQLFSRVYLSLDRRAQNEITEYNRFFEKYRENRAAEISSAVNDSYLKLQGETEGEKSYGLVVNLAVAYVMSLNGQ